MLCDSCFVKRNALNGAWCITRKRYVEYARIEECEDYDDDNL